MTFLLVGVLIGCVSGWLLRGWAYLEESSACYRTGWDAAKEEMAAVAELTGHRDVVPVIHGLACYQYGFKPKRKV